jgi:HlyD family secretion protein
VYRFAGFSGSRRKSVRRIVIGLLVLAGVVAGAWWWLTRAARAPEPLTLYGNVDLRQVQLAFNNSERIVAVAAQEGDHVRRGAVLAQLDRRRLEPQVAQGEARVAAQRQVVQRLHRGNRPEEIAQAQAQFEAQQAIVERLHRGSRPEEIEQARANVVAAEAEAANARRSFERFKRLSAVPLPDRSRVQAVSQSELDDATAALEQADAKLTVSRKALELAIAGPRKEDVTEGEARLAQQRKALELAVIGPRQEDIAQAEAMLRAEEAQLEFLKQQLADTQLLAPADAVVRTRLLEPGEMSTPQRPVFSLAIIDPKWIRAYATETDLGKVRPGMAASVRVDTFPHSRFEGWIGFISPVAEFTPKAVQTEELRTSLVYEVRVFVKDPADELRLGMPATVTFPAGPPGSRTAEASR